MSLLDEDYKVELLKKLPRYHRKLYEYQQINGALTPEFEKVHALIDKVLDEWFIETATVDGISRLESIVGIVPEPTDSLELRRFRLMAKMTEKLPYTDETLEDRLDSICGIGNYTIVRDYDNYYLKVITWLNTDGAFELLGKDLRAMIPCNLVFELFNQQETEINGTLYLGVAVADAKSYVISNDISVNETIQGNNVNGMVFNTANIITIQ